jgi:hypothetical protein
MLSMLTATRVALLIAVASLCHCGTGPALADTGSVDGVSDQNLAYWGPFFSSGLDATLPSFSAEPWAEVLPVHVKYARYVGQWNDPAPFRIWLEHLAPGVTVDLALTNYRAPESFSSGPRNYPATPHAYELALESYLVLAGEVLHHPIGVVEPWNEPNNEGGYRRPSEASLPASFANAAQPLCAEWGCTIVAGDIEDIPDEAGRYLHDYRASLNFRPQAWGVHPYRAVDNYGRSPSGMPEFEEQCGGCRPWFTEVGVFYCERTGERGVYDGPVRQRELAEHLVDQVVPAYRPEHVFYYELKAPETAMAWSQERECIRGEPAVTDTALYSVDGDPRPAASVIFGP